MSWRCIYKSFVEAAADSAPRARKRRWSSELQNVTADS